jgi:hypothetical protein
MNIKIKYKYSCNLNRKDNKDYVKNILYKFHRREMDL